MPAGYRAGLILLTACVLRAQTGKNILCFMNPPEPDIKIVYTLTTTGILVELERLPEISATYNVYLLKGEKGGIITKRKKIHLSNTITQFDFQFFQCTYRIMVIVYDSHGNYLDPFENKTFRTPAFNLTLKKCDDKGKLRKKRQDKEKCYDSTKEPVIKWKLRKDGIFAFVEYLHEDAKKYEFYLANNDEIIEKVEMIPPLCHVVFHKYQLGKTYRIKVLVMADHDRDLFNGYVLMTKEFTLKDDKVSTISSSQATTNMLTPAVVKSSNWSSEVLTSSEITVISTALTATTFLVALAVIFVKKTGFCRNPTNFCKNFLPINEQMNLNTYEMINIKIKLIVIACPIPPQDIQVTASFVTLLKKYADVIYDYSSYRRMAKCQKLDLAIINDVDTVLVIESEGLHRCYSSYVAGKLNTSELDMFFLLCLEYLIHRHDRFSNKLQYSVAFGYTENCFYLQLNSENLYSLSEPLNENAHIDFAQKLNDENLGNLLNDVHNQSSSSGTTELNGREVISLLDAVNKSAQYRRNCPTWSDSYGFDFFDCQQVSSSHLPISDNNTADVVTVRSEESLCTFPPEDVLHSPENYYSSANKFQKDILPNSIVKERPCCFEHADDGYKCDFHSSTLPVINSEESAYGTNSFHDSHPAAPVDDDDSFHSPSLCSTFTVDSSQLNMSRYEDWYPKPQQEQDI